MIMASAEPTAKAGWVVKTLGEVCIVDWGNTELTKKSYIEEGEFLAVSAAGCDGRINHAEHKKFTPVLSAIGAQCGRMFFPEEDFTAIKNTITLTPIQTETYHKFLFHLLTAVELPKRGAAQPFISKGDIQSFPIPLPPLAEQERIVGILDEAFEGIVAATAQAEKNLHNARELFQSVLQSTFSQKGDDWVEVTLQKACSEKITDGTHQTPKYFDDGVVFLSSKNVTSREIDWENIKFIDEKQHLEMHKRIAPRRNDILLAKNGTTGVAALVDRDTIFDIYVSLAWLRPSESINPRLMLYFINSPLAKKQFNKRLKGVGVPNLHLKEIREVIISFPESLSTQQAIVEKLDALSEETKRLEAIYERKQSALTELKQSLLKKAFAGEL